MNQCQRHKGLAINLLCTVLLVATMASAKPKEQIKPPPPVPVKKGPESKPLPPVLTPRTQTVSPTAAVSPRPVDMKLLVLTGDGTEPSYQAIKTFLDQIGIPYQAVVLKNGKLPALSSGTKGYYQGIVLATGNLAICSNGSCISALSPAEWQQLDQYAVDYGVRTLSLYAWPEQRYGITFSGCAVSTSESNPGSLAVSSDALASSLFSYVNRSNRVPVTGAYVYVAAAAPGTGELTTPVLYFSAPGTCAAGGGIAAVYHKKADGREYLALTVDHNPDLLHSLLLNYGLINWVTKGVFLGFRQIYLSPQVDDLLLESDLYDAGKLYCTPRGFLSLDPTSSATSICPEYRITGSDLAAVAAWQAAVRRNSQTSSFTVSMAYNGIGATAEGGAPTPDTLRTWIRQNGSQFFWINHTYSHENLDCYNPVPDSGVCVPASYTEAYSEIQRNIQAANSLKVSPDLRGMVTPGYSGLSNPNFLRAAKNWGIKYLVFDALNHSGPPNTGLVNPLEPSIVMIPRHATNIYYNVRTAATHSVGSEPDEYNDFYGPNGLSPTFPTNQTYSQIIERESTRLLYNMLRYQPYPVMFHQANLYQYEPGKTLMTDLLEATLNKFRSYCTLPVKSLPVSTIGDLLVRRMAYNDSGVQATLVPGAAITLRVSKQAIISITGVCIPGGCETYGGQPISHVLVKPNTPVIVYLNR